MKSRYFDVDGTLVDSVDLHARGCQDTFREFEKDIPFQEIRMQIGKGGDQLMPVFSEQGGIRQLRRQMSKRRGEMFKEKYLRESIPSGVGPFSALCLSRSWMCHACNQVSGA